MKNLHYLYILFFLLFSCSKTEDIVNPDSEDIEWRGLSVTTDPAIEITSFTATSGGNVGSAGGGNAVTEKGICYAVSPNPTTNDFKIFGGTGSGPFTCEMYSLSSATMYYIRAYAIKKGVTTYGNQVSFTTYPDDGPVTDIDGHVYQTVNIGGQIWMMENLKTTHFRDGTPITNVTDDNDWFNLTAEGYCNYNNDEAVADIYGRLYNWYAASDVRGIAPEGWHVPSYAEWDILKNYLGGSNVAGGKAKEAGLTHWNSPNTGATNSSGFNSIPGGHRWVNLTGGGSPDWFSGLGQESDWWTATATSESDAHFVETNYNTTQMYRSGFLGGVGYYDKRTGYALRCVKD